MQTKLTLRLEDDLINKAKKFARKREKSLSKIVADYFRYLTSEQMTDESELPPVVKSLHGALSGKNVKEKDYKDYLEKKYL